MSDKEIDINKLIDINLRLIFERYSKEAYYTDFEDEKENRLTSLTIDPKTIAVEMEENGLIWINGENCKLKSKGESVHENGGWLKHLDAEKEKTSNITPNTINVFGDNKGFIGQDSDFSNTPIKIKTKPAPSNNPDKKSLLIRILSNPWFIGVSLVLLAVLLSADRIMEFVNKHINGI